MAKSKPAFKGKKIEIVLDHNPYQVSFYNSKNNLKNIIIFPLFHFEGERQFYDLLAPIINRGDQVIVINFITKHDRVLYLEYYFEVFERIIFELFSSKVIRKDQTLTLLGFGVGAYLASKLHKNPDLNISKMILISPVNSYKAEYELSDEIVNFTVPTYIHFGQNDNVVSLENRFKIFEKGRLNPLVKFSAYPVCGHYLYYKDILSLRLEEYYKKHHYNPLVGKKSKYKASALPEEAILNDAFFTHLFNELDDIPNKPRIALLTDVCPLFVNGVAVVIDLLQLELQKLGYEVYIGALWNNNSSYKELPKDTYIPIPASYASFLKGNKELHMLKTFQFTKSAKMLSLFGFDYIHLHTEYSVGVIALKLAKLTGINVLYTYHTLWNLYYEKKFGLDLGNIIYKTAKSLIFQRIYNDCKIITVPSQKSYEILKKDVGEKDIRIIPSPVNVSRFEISKMDKELINNLRDSYGLKHKKVLGYVGRVSLEKNIVETLQYIAKIKHEIPNLAFIIVGIGDAVPMLKKTVKKLDLEENVIFVGEIENSKLKYYYSLFDVFVTASNFETQGLTYFEAAVCGTPILAKADTALDGVFVDEENALIYHNYDEWVSRLEKALFDDIKPIVKNAKKTMLNYSSDKWAKQLVGIYKELNPKKEND